MLCKQLERVKWFLWHGNVGRALDTIDDVEGELDLLPQVPEVCRLAVDRMKLMPAIHGEFTLHDDTHLLRVTELMARVIPEQVLENVLNPPLLRGFPAVPAKLRASIT